VLIPKSPVNRDIRAFLGATFGITTSKNENCSCNSFENDKENLDLEDHVETEI